MPSLFPCWAALDILSLIDLDPAASLHDVIPKLCQGDPLNAREHPLTKRQIDRRNTLAE
jgi:hypothetical protein